MTTKRAPWADLERLGWLVGIDHSDRAFARYLRALVVCRGHTTRIEPDGGGELRRGGCVYAVTLLPVGTEKTFAQAVQPLSMSSVFALGHPSTDIDANRRLFRDARWSPRGKCLLFDADARKPKP